MTETIRLFIGYDPREAAAYHVFSDSVIEHASVPISIHPLTLQSLDFKREGSNSFTLSRYLIPLLCEYRGWAIWMDGDMVLTRDIAELWYARPLDKAVSVVKHDYQTKARTKYIGTTMQAENQDYPRKNWSSVVIWNCGHFSNQKLTREYVQQTPPSTLHRFGWLKDHEIGEIPAEWNYLVGEEAPSSAACYHYTLGVPGIKHYRDTHASWHWHRQLVKALACAGEDTTDMVERSQDRVGS